MSKLHSIENKNTFQGNFELWGDGHVFRDLCIGIFSSKNICIEFTINKFFYLEKLYNNAFQTFSHLSFYEDNVNCDI